MRRTRALLYVLLCVVLLAVLVPTPGSVALAAVRSVTVSLQDLAPEPVSGHVDGGRVSSYLVYLDNPDARFYIYLVRMELSTRSTEPFPVRVYDHDGGLAAWGTVGGSHPPAFVADLYAERDIADALGWDYIVQVDNSSNTRGKDFILTLEGHVSTVLHGCVRFDDGTPIPDANIVLTCRRSGASIFVSSDSEGLYSADRCPLDIMEPSVEYRGIWESIWPALDLEGCQTCSGAYTQRDLATPFQPPERVSSPSVPTGPFGEEAGQSITFQTGGAISNLGHSLEYRFQWGNGTYSTWSASATASHAWAVAGSYVVRAQARCAAHTNVVSGWSGGKTVEISPPPETVAKPDRPWGPSSNEVGQILSFGTGGASSNLGHSVEYRFDWGDKTQSGWSSSPGASHSWSSPGTYSVKAQARCSSHGILSAWSDGRSVTISPPPEVVSVPGVPAGPLSGEVGQTLAYSTGGASSNLGHGLQYRFDWGDGTQSQWSTSSSASHSWSSQGPHRVRAQARCAAHAEVVSGWSADVTVSITLPPETVAAPNVPGGPASGRVGQNLTYSTGGGTSNLGHDVEYRFDWGDGTQSGWAPVTSASHSWADQGTYDVRAQARCAVHPSVASAWSESKLVTIDPPPEAISPPDTPFGPSRNEIGQNLTYSTAGAGSNLGHSLQYRFDWGDGTQSAWSSSTAASHSWSSPGNFEVRSQARCAAHTDVVSAWSAALAVVINPPPELVSIPNVPVGPNAGDVGRDLVFRTGGASSNLGHEIEDRLDWGDGTQSAWQSSSSASYEWSSHGPFNVRAQARCALHPTVVSGWSGSMVVTVSPTAETVSAPNVPAGPHVLKSGQTATFSTGGASSNLGHTLEYRFDWGDGTQSGWSSATSASHVWSGHGPHAVRAQARCATHPNVISGWSALREITVEAPPESVNMPNAPAGPSRNEAGKELEFTTGGARSSLNHSVEYRFDWGDKSRSEWSSEPRASHAWSASGNFAVKAQARSAASPAVVSDWSDAKKVVIDPADSLHALAVSHVELGVRMDASGSILEAMRLSDDDGCYRVAVLEGTRALSAIGTPLGAIDMRTVLEPPLPPDGHYIVGQAIHLGPEGASFSPPVILTMSYDRASYSDKVIESTLVIASYDVEKERWVECESAVDAVSGTVVAQVGHFSTFALLGKSANQSSASVGWALALGIIAAALTVGLVAFFVVNRRRRLQHLDSGLDQL